MKENNCLICEKLQRKFGNEHWVATCWDCLDKRLDEMELAEQYKERVHSVENGESKSYEVESVEDVFNLIDKED